MDSKERVNFGMTDEEFIKWLGKFPKPEGCRGCGRIAGACINYPNCPANPEFVMEEGKEIRC